MRSDEVMPCSRPHSTEPTQNQPWWMMPFSSRAWPRWNPSSGFPVSPISMSQDTNSLHRGGKKIKHRPLSDARNIKNPKIHEEPLSHKTEWVRSAKTIVCSNNQQDFLCILSCSSEFAQGITKGVNWEIHNVSCMHVWLSCHSRQKRGNKPGSKTTSSSQSSESPNELNWIIPHNVMTRRKSDWENGWKITERDRGRGGRVAVAKLYQIAYLEFGLTKETKQTRPAGPLKLQGSYFQAMMDVAGCQYPVERGNYIDFRETTEQTPPPFFR